MLRLPAVLRAIGLVFGLCVALAARASPVTFEFSGSLYAVDPDLAAAFAPGDRFSGSFTYESSTPFLDGSPDDGKLYDALLGLSVTVGAYTLAWAPPGMGLNPVTVTNDSLGSDGFAIQAYPPFFESGLSASGISAMGFVFTLVDSTASVFASALTLPDALDLATFDLARLYIGFGTPSGSGLIEGNVGALSVSNKVPEPNGLMLLALAFAALVAGLRVSFRAEGEESRRRARA